MNVLKVEHICKSYNGFKAVDDVSFTVDTGHLYGLLGPNGAGKTTTIRMIMNILIPDTGSISLFGQKMSDDLKSNIGYLPEERGLYPKMKILDLLIFLGELHSMKSSEARQAALHWLQRMELGEYADKKTQELSKGMQQKIQFIGTILHDPKLIILDEPFSGLDPLNVNLIKDILLEFREQDKAIIFSTHQMETAEKLCDEILMINQGKKVLDGPLAGIQNQYGSNSIHLEYEGNHQVFEHTPLIQSVDDFGNYAEIKLRDGVSPQDLLRYLIDKITITRFETRKSSLNEIFIQQVEGGEDTNE